MTFSEMIYFQTVQYHGTGWDWRCDPMLCFCQDRPTHPSHLHFFSYTRFVLNNSPLPYLPRLGSRIGVWCGHHYWRSHLPTCKRLLFFLSFFVFFFWSLLQELCHAKSLPPIIGASMTPFIYTHIHAFQNRTSFWKQPLKLWKSERRLVNLK